LSIQAYCLKKLTTSETMSRKLVSPDEACVVRARGFLWGTTSAAVCTFFSDSQVEAVNFLDDLHGECYVELRSKEDLARALDKHALRVGTRLRRRLIEVYPATIVEMNRALMKGEGSEAASSRRRRQGREERLKERSMGRSRTSRSRTRRRRSRSSTRSRSRSCRWGRVEKSSSDEDQSHIKYRDLRARSRAKSCKSKLASPGKSQDGIPDKRSSSSKSRYASRRDGGARNEKRSRSSSDSHSSPDTGRSSQDERGSWRMRRSNMKQFTRTVHREVNVKREKCEVQTSPSPSPCPRHRSEKDGRDEHVGIQDGRECRSTVKTEPGYIDQSIMDHWKDDFEMKDHKIQSKNEEIKTKEQEIRILSEEGKIKDEELRLARNEVLSKEEEALSKDNLIQSQCEEISKLKSKLEKQEGEANTLRASVDLFKEKNEEKEKYLSNMKITQESSTEQLARLEGNMKTLEAQTVAHREHVNRMTVEIVALEENVNQLTVEKELVEMKSCKLQRLNENLRGQLEKKKERDADLDKLRSFLDGGRAEIAEMREELRQMKVNGFSKGRGAAAADLELVKMKEGLINLNAENKKFKTSWAIVKEENATLRKDLQELQQVEHRLRWEVGRLKNELDNVKKENNNNSVRGQNNNYTREQVPASDCTDWCQNLRAQAPPRVGAASNPAQIGPFQQVAHHCNALEIGVVKRDIA